MLFLIIEIIFLIIIFFIEDYFVYKWIRKIDKKEREKINKMELEHLDKMIVLEEKVKK